jgi:hypothetical protein
MEAILEGTPPVDMTVQQLSRAERPLLWAVRVGASRAAPPLES